MEILLDDLTDAPVKELLAYHLSGMRGNSPPDGVYALDLTALGSTDVALWSAWEGDILLGVGALKELTATSGEIKSMRTHADHLRKGVGLSILDHIIDVAKQRGYARLSLETGSGEQFEAALAMYRKRGFINGEPFGGYRASAFNQFLHLPL